MRIPHGLMMHHSSRKEWFLKPNTLLEFGIMKVGTYLIEHYTNKRIQTKWFLFSKTFFHHTLVFKFC
jgi:hypothetical protein